METAYSSGNASPCERLRLLVCDWQIGRGRSKLSENLFSRGAHKEPASSIAMRAYCHIFETSARTPVALFPVTVLWSLNNSATALLIVIDQATASKTHHYSAVTNSMTLGADGSRLRAAGHCSFMDRRNARVKRWQVYALSASGFRFQQPDDDWELAVIA